MYHKPPHTTGQESSKGFLSHTKKKKRHNTTQLSSSSSSLSIKTITRVNHNGQQTTINIQIELITMSLLTAERLVKLAYKYPNLSNTWYLIATACLTVINQPDEIPKLYHFALRQQLLEDAPTTGNNSLLTNKYLLQLANDSIESAKRYQDLTAVGMNLPDILIPPNYYDKLPLNFKFNKGEDILNVRIN